MLIGKFNTLQFLEDKTLQRWDNADNKQLYFYFLEQTIPAFVFVSDTAQSTATVQLFNKITEVAVGAAQSVTITTSGTKKILSYAGVTLPATGLDCGSFYLKIVTGASVETYYSQVFGWVNTATANSATSNLLKITAVSSNISLSNLYTIPLTGITYSCYIETEQPVEDADITEEGNEKPYGDIPVFNTLAFTYEHEIFGTKDIFRFLCGLRILKTNGTITFTYRGVDIHAYDITCEKDDSTEDTMSMKLKYKDTDYISSSNEI